MFLTRVLVLKQNIVCNPSDS